MTFANAGHNYPVVGRYGGGDLLLDRGGLVLGIMEAVDYEENSIQLQTGDRLVLYTDGITEAANAEQEMFGEDRLREVLRALPQELAARQVADRVFEALSEFLGGTEALDDQTLMVVRMVEPAGALLEIDREELVETARETV
jgi:sigma-B regulation protein RsbU (phosphoserine phosphatase)